MAAKKRRSKKVEAAEATLSPQQPGKASALSPDLPLPAEAAPAPSKLEPAAPPVVGIGASAGGLEAITDLLKAVPADSGLALVVVSHLDPEHKSALGEILARVTSMPVRDVEDGLVVEPNHVYVMPPNSTMVLARGAFHLTARAKSRGPHMPVDTFLYSLAQERGSQAIGVILSGTASDGTRGLKAIKEQGGITFAQDRTARFGGMPSSAIAAGCVDFVLPPPQIAAELLRIVRHPAQVRLEEARPPAMPGKEDTFVQILRLLGDSTGVDFLNYRRTTLRRRIERRMLLRRLQTPAEYLQCLRDDAAERRSLSEEVLIPVTGFFRDPDVFEALKNFVFPRLLQNRPADAPLRLWVPGCASGEEAYSLAICLLEFLGTRAGAVPIKIFATDISEGAIEAARAGAYGEGITGEVSAERLQRFFLKADRGYEVSKVVRDVCAFARQDVTKDPPFSQLDLISCRNVLIYLGPALQDRILPIFHYALRPGGVLVLGTSETVGGFTDLFEVVEKKHKFYVRTATPSRLTLEYTPGITPRTRVVVREAGVEPDHGFQGVSREADRVILADYAPAGVVVDENLHVVQVRGDTGHHLKLAPGPLTANVLQMAREGLLGDLRDALDRAKQDGAPAHKAGVRVKANDHFREIDLRVIPITDPASGVRHFVILFEEARPPSGGEAAVPGAPVPVTPAGESAKDREIGRLKHELEANRSFLQAVIEQKEGSNVELRSANEEVISANEELQSANEELETAKEELQATNEELTTVNDELQNRIRTANSLSDDLVNLIETTNIPIVVLGADLRIRRFTPSSQRVLNLLPGDMGRPIGDLKLKVNIPDLESLAFEVIDTLEIKQREIQDEKGAWHKLYIRPYKTMDQKIGGAVVMLIDIDVLKRREHEIEESRDYAVSIVETVREPLIVLDAGLRVQMANRAFYQAFRVNPEETEGRLIYELGNRQWDIPRLRTLLEELLPQNSHFEDFEVDHEFPAIGRRTMLLNAHCVVQRAGETSQLILLAIEDLTERRDAEEARQRAEARFTEMVKNVRDHSIFLMDPDGVITSWNVAAERIIGYPEAEVVGRHFSLIFTPEDVRDGLPERELRQAREEGRAEDERWHQKKGGERFWALGIVTPLRDTRGRLTGFSKILRDITERKRVEEELRRARDELEVRVAERTAELARANASLTEVLRRLVTAQEDERRRVSRELHDGMGQELTALILGLKALERIMPGESPGRAQLRDVEETAVRIGRGAHDLAVELRPTALDDIGLGSALASYIPRWSERTGVAAELQAHGLGDDRLSTEVETAVYRLIQEALNNVARHAGARHVSVIVEHRGDEVTALVEDDGCGFDPERVASGPDRRLGLIGMQDRVALVGGILLIESGDGAGTTVRARFPIPRTVSE